MEPLQNAVDNLAEEGYCCSQILAQLILRAQGKENDDLVRSLAGLCHGIGQSGDTCGILTGGACILSYLMGADKKNDPATIQTHMILDDFLDWFNTLCEEQYGSNHCYDIIGSNKAEGPNKKHCRELITKSWVHIIGLLSMYNVAYAAPQSTDKE